jgi:hypothetical protein
MTITLDTVDKFLSIQHNDQYKWTGPDRTGPEAV